MKKGSSKRIGKKSNLIIESNKLSSNSNDAKLQDKLLQLDDSEIEALFEAGKINQNEYEYILNFRKKMKLLKRQMLIKSFLMNKNMILMRELEIRGKKKD